MHVTGVRLDVGPVFEFEDEAVLIAAVDQNHARLIVCGAVMRGHKLISVHVKHCDHFIRTAFAQPGSEC